MTEAKRALALGAGSVSRPCVQYLLDRGHNVTVVDVSESSVKRALAGRANGFGAVRDAVAETRELIREYKPDIVVCLLPTRYMAATAGICVDEGVSMIGASYASGELRAFDGKARERGVKILCEVGLDPGIDHMSAVAMIKSIHDGGGQLESFVSMCGALPDAASNTNPIGYKLSWAPASLIGASRRSARIMKDGVTIDMPDGRTYQNAEFFYVRGLGWFEAYANADSLPYIDAYGISGVRTIKRGTLRYFGWCDMITQMQKLDLFDERERDFSGYTYASLMKEITGDQSADAKDSAARFLGVENNSLPVLKLEWLGFFSESAVEPRRGSLRDVLAGRYSDKLGFAPGEKDIIAMQHEFVAFYPSRNIRKKFTSTLVERGSVDGDTAIARTTGLPLGIAAHLVLSGSVRDCGVLIPTTEDIYVPALNELKREGISFTDAEEIL